MERREKRGHARTIDVGDPEAGVTAVEARRTVTRDVGVTLFEANVGPRVVP